MVNFGLPNFNHKICMLCCWGHDNLIDNNTTIKLSPADVLQPPFPMNGVITIQSEYLKPEKDIMHQYACDHAVSSHSRGLLVTGMAGVGASWFSFHPHVCDLIVHAGKSVFLLYLLAKTLARKQPVCMYIQEESFAILDPKPSDVYIVPNSSRIFKYRPLFDLFLLIDMSGNPLPYPLDFMTRSNVFYHVVAASPNPELPLRT